MSYKKEKIHTIVRTQALCDYQRDLVVNHITPVYKQLCVFSPLRTTLRPEDGRARPKHEVTIGNKYKTKTVVFLDGPHLLLLIYINTTGMMNLKIFSAEVALRNLMKERTSHLAELWICAAISKSLIQTKPILSLSHEHG
jgi:hypothetical protein